MAATVSSVWSKPGAWALESEENEAELLRQSKEEELINKSDTDLTDFPSLSAAAATKTKKKKPQTISLGEFTNSKYSNPSQRAPTFQDLSSLPTGPRERTADELDRSKLGGGFRSYGGGYDRNRNADGDDSSNSRWGSSRVSDESRRQGGFGRDSNSEFQSSRADDVDDWGATKKTLVNNGLERRGDRGGGGGGFFGSESKADESDNWGSNKSFVPSEGGRRFEGHRERRVVGFESSGGSDSDNWGKKKEDEGRKFVAAVGAFDSLRERRGGFESGDSETWGKKREDGVGSVRPKLNLQPRSLPVNDNQQQNSSEVPAAAKPKASNPFGEARPREEVLKEKGQDWKEMDEKLESLKLKETTTDVKRSFFENGNEKINLSEAKTERSWRKPESDNAIPQGVEEKGNGNGGEDADGEVAVENVAAENI
ncbi:eukaryotic translation initiation factor 4B3-like [Impatiens glandulifera]|uniref:eukaryotic translation initiation factor 4B3-like n=1 Tax=Impatiens glandulifera TaxID=253017 RepID=UPI001FB12A12|nr:eukaryotic translation initiation factor 4B3-like [Impatiens glandulifera]